MSFILQENRDLMTNSIFFGALNTLEDLTEKLGREKRSCMEIDRNSLKPSPLRSICFYFYLFFEHEVIMEETNAQIYKLHEGEEK